MAARRLPEGFESLEPFASAWAIPRESDRRRKRATTPMPEHREFYEAVKADWPRIADFLKQRDAFSLKPDEQNLLDLAKSFIESGISVTLLGVPESPYAIDCGRLAYLHET